MEGLNYLLGLVRKGSKDTVPIIFVLNEIDHFVKHPKQNILYNLFDMTVTSLIPIAVIGLTVQLDVVELFEKRVKSRFQLRYIHLFPAENYGEFLRVIRSVLSVPQDLTASPYAKDFNASLDELFEDRQAFCAALNRLQIEVRRDDRQTFKRPFALLDVMLLRHNQLEQMPDGGRDDVLVVLEIVLEFLKLSERLADVAGDRRFLCDDESLAHVAALLYAARYGSRNLFFSARRQN